MADPDIEQVMADDPDFGYKQEPSWTSIDMYYKGFHVKKSMPNNIKPEELIKGIEGYIKAGFEPSWNTETNKQNGHVEQPALSSTIAVPICPIHNKEMVKRVGKFGEFWSCPTKDAQGNWCKHKPQ